MVGCVFYINHILTPVSVPSGGIKVDKYLYNVLIPVIYIRPLGWIVIGFVTGFWFNNTVVFSVTGILVLLIALAVIDIRRLGGKGDSLIDFWAIIFMTPGLLVLWITTISVNQW